MKRDSVVHCVELIPGEPLQEVPKKQNEEPPEGFVDNVVYRYRLDENGNKVFLGTMPAFPENWDAPLNPFRKKEQGEGKMSKDKRNPGPKREDREEIMEKVRELVAKGTSVRKAAKLLNVPESTIYTWLAKERKKAQKQTPDPTSAQVGSQEPERENQEPAEDSITPEAAEKVTPPPKNDGFGPEDDEPIPYVPVPLEDLIAELREDLDLERHKVAELEKKIDLLVSAAASAPTPETRLARLLVAVFREMESRVSA